MRALGAGGSEDEVARAIAAYADRSIDGSVLKGLARKKDDPGDRENEELEVSRLVLCSLGYASDKLRSEPAGLGKPPDVAAVQSDGSEIGIEVTELVDKASRQQRVRRRDAERRLGLNPREAFTLEIAGRNPTPDHLSRVVYEAWPWQRLRQALAAAIATKDSKAAGHRLNGVDLDRYAELVLAIFTGPEVTHDVLAAAQGAGPFACRHVHRVAVVMDYEPALPGYPIVFLDIARL